MGPSPSQSSNRAPADRTKSLTDVSLAATGHDAQLRDRFTRAFAGFSSSVSASADQLRFSPARARASRRRAHFDARAPRGRRRVVRRRRRARLDGRSRSTRRRRRAACRAPPRVTALGRRLRRGRPARRASVARRSGGVVALDVTQPEPNPIVVRETTSDFARVVWSGGSSGGFHDPRSCTSRASAARATACARRRCASGIRCLRRPSSASSARAHCRSSRAPNGRAISSSSAPWSRARSSRSTWRRLRRSSFASCTFAAPSTSLSRASERDRWTSPRRDARHRRRGSRLLRGRSPRRPLESPAKSQPRRGRVLARAVLLLHA